MQDLLNDNGSMRLKKCRRGPMLYSANDTAVGGLLDTYGEFSEGEVQMLAKLVTHGDTVIEVGANIGALTVPLAQFVGPQGNVVAFEPQRVLFQTLCANVALNGLTNVRTVHAAVGAESGSVTLPKIDYATPGMFGAHSIEDATDGEQVQLIALDRFLRTDRCRLIKIDVEGMEAQVIEGARALIQAQKPILYVENDRQDRSSELIRLLLNLGYRLYWHLPPLARDDNFFGAKHEFMAGYISINMLCVPPAVTVTGMDAQEIKSPDDWWQNLKPQS